MHRVLLIDDDEQLSGLLQEFFAPFNLKLDHVIHPEQGLTKLKHTQYDLLILDIMLPDLDGFEVCKLIRKTSQIPILMLSARGEVMDRIVGIELGADDYLSKPFEPRELVVRIQSILKRTDRQTVNTLLCYGDLEVNTDYRTVTVNDKEVLLSAMEYQFLLLLIYSPGKTFTRDEILNHLKGIDTEIFSRSVDILVSRLRHKLSPLDSIKTVRGQGYVFLGVLT